MQKNILLTGATDGIGLEAAKMLAARGQNLLIHGRSDAKLEDVVKTLAALPGAGTVESYTADLSCIRQVDRLADEISDRHTDLDVLINNAGVFKTSQPVSEQGLDIRFMVNTIAPYHLTRRLLPLLSSSGRIINLSSAAQAPVNADALAGRITLTDMEAYAQSKLAITMWSRELALESGAPIVIAVNPGSLLATKMVKEGFGTEGSDTRIGADILCRVALDEEFANASGQYFDNDSGRFAPPHEDALDAGKSAATLSAIESVLSTLLSQGDENHTT